MSVQRPGPAQQRLLPAAFEHSLSDLAIRIAGGALVAFAVTSWLSLLSWQMRASGSAGGSAKIARNLLGNFGAGLSDMMVHTLGIAVVFALICPMIWGLELLSSVRWIGGFRIKVLAALGAVLSLAGVASGLPPVPGWPLLGGAGGMIGDFVYNFTTANLAHFGFDRDSWLPVLLLVSSGLLLLSASLGIHVPIASLRRRMQPQTASEPQLSTAVTAGQPAGGSTDAPEPRGNDIANGIVHAPASGPIPVRAQPDIEDAAEEEERDNSTRAFAERFAPGVVTGTVKDAPRLMPAIKATLAGTRSRAGYRRPSINLLRRGSSDTRRPHIDVEAGAVNLIEVLGAFGVKGEIREARPGPVVTRYELEPVRGTKIARVIGLADDFARELGASSIRVSATPGRTTIGIEVPNDVREQVVLRDILESETFTSSPMQLPLAIGKGIAGEPVVLDLARMPHLLVAGTTGSGKSVGLNAMILSLIYRLEPKDLRLLLIDPKMLELSQYDRIPHLLNPVITDPTEATQALEWAVAEMEERYRRMAQQSTRNIESFNAKVRSAISTGVGLSRTVQTGFDAATGRAIYERQQLDDNPMPYIVIVIDELADLMVTAGKRVEGLIQRLAQKARAAGIHLVMATQRPSVDVVTGTIKANFPIRISFRVASKIDSRTIINEPGAEQLLGHGDMLLTSGSGQHLRVHGAYVADEEIERVAEALREQGEPQYVELLGAGEPRQRTASAARRGPAEDIALAAERQQEELYASAVAIVAGDRKVSSGHLHRRMGIPQATAGELIQRMEREGLVGPVNLIGRRQILVPSPQALPRGRRTAA